MLFGRRVPDAKDKSSGALISSPGRWLLAPFPPTPPELPGTPRSTPEHPEENTTARGCTASIPSAVSNLCFSNKKRSRPIASAIVAVRLVGFTAP